MQVTYGIWEEKNDASDPADEVLRDKVRMFPHGFNLDPISWNDNQALINEGVIDQPLSDTVLFRLN